MSEECNNALMKSRLSSWSPGPILVLGTILAVGRDGSSVEDVDFGRSPLDPWTNPKECAILRREGEIE